MPSTIALGAQIQTKAGDQWGYFQANKLRGAIQNDSLELLRAIGEVRPAGGTLIDKPPVPPELRLDPVVQSALDAVETRKAGSEIAVLVRGVPEPVLQSALKSAREVAEAFEAASGPLFGSSTGWKGNCPRAIVTRRGTSPEPG